MHWCIARNAKLVYVYDLFVVKILFWLLIMFLVYMTLINSCHFLYLVLYKLIIE